MERRKFIKSCCYSTLGLTIGAAALQSCDAIYYATAGFDTNRMVVAKSEFWKIKNDKKTERPFVLVKTAASQFPICLYKMGERDYIASLLKCTHRGCELNVGGNIYSCPCHGSEFSITGKVLEGPAIEDLKTFKTEIDDQNIYIHLS